MSGRNSKSSKTSSVPFDVCAVGATSTPVKSSPDAAQTGGARTFRAASLSLNGEGGGGGGGARSSVRGAHSQDVPPGAPNPQRRRTSRSGDPFGSFLDQSTSGTSRRDDLNLSDGPDSVARLLEEEAEDVRLAAMLSKTTGAFGPPPTSFPPSESLRHAQKDKRALPVGDSVLYLGEGEEPTNLSPSDVAAMMHHLEHGVSMAAPPDQLFKFLFPNASGPSRSDPRQTTKKEAGALNRPEAEPEAEAGVNEGEGEREAENTNTLHKDESCPIACFADCYPGSGIRTLMQLRGATAPSWFPGYFVALPGTGGVLEVKGSPTEVMQAAYMAASPRNFPTECRFAY